MIKQITDFLEKLVFITIFFGGSVLIWNYSGNIFLKIQGIFYLITAIVIFLGAIWVLKNHLKEKIEQRLKKKKVLKDSGYKISPEDKKEMRDAFIDAMREIKEQEEENNIFSMSGEPFLALIENKDLYDVFLVNPTNIKYTGVKKLTGGFASGDDFLVETGKAVFHLPELNPHSYIKIDDIHYTERDFIIWYELDLTLENGSKIYKRGSVPKYISEKTHLVEYLNKEGWELKLIDRPLNESIDEIVKKTDMKSKFTTFNEDGSIKKRVKRDFFKK